MARRKQSFIEEVIEMISMLPWWVGVLIALVSYIVFHSIASSTLDSAPQDIKQLGEFASRQIFITFSTILQYVIPFAALLGSLISVFSGKANNTKDTTPQSNRADKAYSPKQHQPSNIACPLCSQPMVKRKSRKGANAGQEFWGCSNFPSCKGTRPL